MLGPSIVCGIRNSLAKQGTRLVNHTRFIAVLPSTTYRQVHTTHPLLKKQRKEWVQDQSQREVNAILQADKTVGPTKKPLKLFTYEDEELGVMKKFEAERMAEEKNLKLVPVDEASNPMIFKLMNGKQLMEFNRSVKKKSKKKEHKKLQMTLNISEHDLELKLKHVEDWLNHGHNVDIEVKSKHYTADPEVGAMQSNVFQRLTDGFSHLATVQQATRTEASLKVFLLNKTEHKS